MKKILISSFFFLAGIQFWACSKYKPTPDYTKEMLGIYEGTLTDSGRFEQILSYVGKVEKSKLTVESDPAELNQLIVKAYIGDTNIFKARGKAKSKLLIMFEQQGTNLAFKAEGIANVKPNTIGMELKVSDVKYFKYVGMKKR